MVHPICGKFYSGKIFANLFDYLEQQCILIRLWHSVVNVVSSFQVLRQIVLCLAAVIIILIAIVVNYCKSVIDMKTGIFRWNCISLGVGSVCLEAFLDNCSPLLFEIENLMTLRFLVGWFVQEDVLIGFCVPHRTFSSCWCRFIKVKLAFSTGCRRQPVR